jgi:hypothetical protein
MTTISNVDRVILLIRQRLKEHARAAGKGPAPEAGRKSLAEHVRALAALEGVDQRAVKRVLIEQILAAEFGADMVNDASFQQVVERVLEALDTSDAAQQLTASVVAALKQSAGAR